LVTGSLLYAAIEDGAGGVGPMPQIILRRIIDPITIKTTTHHGVFFTGF
jgi:hypothetical protein